LNVLGSFLFMKNFFVRELRKNIPEKSRNEISQEEDFCFDYIIMPFLSVIIKKIAYYYFIKLRLLKSWVVTFNL